MNTLATATQCLSQPCGPLPVKDCRVRHKGNDNGKKRHFWRREFGLARTLFSIYDLWKIWISSELQ